MKMSDVDFNAKAEMLFHDAARAAGTAYIFPQYTTIIMELARTGEDYYDQLPMLNDYATPNLSSLEWTTAQLFGLRLSCYTLAHAHQTCAVYHEVICRSLDEAHSLYMSNSSIAHLDVHSNEAMAASPELTGGIRHLLQGHTSSRRITEYIERKVWKIEEVMYRIMYEVEAWTRETEQIYKFDEAEAAQARRHCEARQRAGSIRTHPEQCDCATAARDSIPRRRRIFRIDHDVVFDPRLGNAMHNHDILMRIVKLEKDMRITSGYLADSPFAFLASSADGSTFSDLAGASISQGDETAAEDSPLPVDESGVWLEGHTGEALEEEIAADDIEDPSQPADTNHVFPDGPFDCPVEGIDGLVEDVAAYNYFNDLLDGPLYSSEDGEASGEEERSTNGNESSSPDDIGNISHPIKALISKLFNLHGEQAAPYIEVSDFTSVHLLTDMADAMFIYFETSPLHMRGDVFASVGHIIWDAVVRLQVEQGRYDDDGRLSLEGLDTDALEAEILAYLAQDSSPPVYSYDVLDLRADDQAREMYGDDIPYVTTASPPPTEQWDDSDSTTVVFDSDSEQQNHRSGSEEYDSADVDFMEYADWSLY